jgi:hypothetical protein
MDGQLDGALDRSTLVKAGPLVRRDAGRFVELGGGYGYQLGPDAVSTFTAKSS